jgi:hypothetical protein
LVLYGQLLFPLWVVLAGGKGAALVLHVDDLHVYLLGLGGGISVSLSILALL